MNKKCVKKCISSPGITVGVGQCEFPYNIVNFHKKRSFPKEIQSEVEVSIVKVIVITRDDCIAFKLLIWYKTVRHLLKQDYSNNSILWVIYRDIRIFKDTGANIQIDIAEAKWITILTFHFYHTFVTSQ